MQPADLFDALAKVIGGDAQAPAALVTEQSTRAPHEQHASASILLVEDNRVNQHFTRRLLEKLGTR